MALRERMRNGLMYILLVYSAIYGLLWFVMLLWHGTVPMRKNILLIFTLFFEPSQFIKIASAVLPFALIAALALLIGTVSPSETIKRFGRWRARRWKAKLDKQLKEKGERLLFGARIKKESFFGGYPIGLVTKLYQKQGKPYCNIFKSVFYHLLSLIPNLTLF